MRDYLHIELVFLTLLERDASLRIEIEEKAALWRAEDTAYGLQASLGLGWMVNDKCAPVTTPRAALPANVRRALDEIPLVKLRHEDRQWLAHMPASVLLGSADSVIGALLSRNAGPLEGSARGGGGELEGGVVTCGADASELGNM